jgi:hypothetical protein
MPERSNDAGLAPVPALDDREDNDRDDEAGCGNPQELARVGILAHQWNI